ncbi:hypothetical protein P1S61_28510 [Streptomyces sp. ME08-AFT2]|uniref:hypothetical protein n=1 Tax=Streptomyces sp. ME08-AFT2 TaxID=3028683 RepID=UPI0029B23055|nr:hypothetical protein [Streptomyces sp. ME08-AFT2]MDX3312949.1 hypothetical protein [Streptomyces sp. ME08-AFT2]
MNDQSHATGEAGEQHPSPEDDSQSITAPTPEVGQHGDGAAGAAGDRSSPTDGSQSIDAPTPEVGQHSSGPPKTPHDGHDGQEGSDGGGRGGESATEPAKSRPVAGTAQRDDRAEGDR